MALAQSMGSQSDDNGARRPRPLPSQARHMLVSAEKPPLSMGTGAFKNKTTFALMMFSVFKTVCSWALGPAPGIRER